MLSGREYKSQYRRLQAWTWKSRFAVGVVVVLALGGALGMLAVCLGWMEPPPLWERVSETGIIVEGF